MTAERTERLFVPNWPDMAAKEEAWRKFRVDEKWREITRVTKAEHGEFVGKIEDRVLTPTRYSRKVSPA